MSNMTVYELIQMLSEYDADKEVAFHFNGEFFVDKVTEKATYDDDVDIEDVQDDDKLIIFLTN